MIRYLSLLLLAGAAQAVSPSATTIRIAIIGTPSPESAQGLDFGEIEMTQTAKLLGSTVQRATSADDAVYGAINAGDVPADGRPVIFLSARKGAHDGCHFAIGAPEMDGAVLWHSSLDRFGASELNERFMRRYGAPMSAEAWAGWAAMKALVESALRRRADEDPCAALGRLRFDGHKGRPLFFDPQTRILTQPRYLLKDGRVIGERE